MRLIDVDALWEAINGDKRGKGIAQMRSGKVLQTLTLVLEHIHTAPTIDAVPMKKAHWIKKGNEKTCSGCGFIYYSNNDEWNYCPNCGAGRE